jgi:polyisoprenoid-binding protein YceI
MKKKAIIITLGLCAAAGIFIFSMDWGTVKSEIKKSELKVNEIDLEERTTFTDLNGMSSGKYVAQTELNDKVELLFNIEVLKKTTGRFNDIAIDLIVAENRDSSELVVKIKTGSIFTNNTSRDKSLVSNEYFNVEQFPFIEYTSNTIKRGDTSLVTIGQLQFMGEKNYLEFPLTVLGQGINSEDSEFTAFEGQFDFDRTKYGMPEESGIGNIVHVSFYCEVLLKTD